MNINAARKHRHRYHGVPVPFEFEDRQYLVTTSNNRYSCPLPRCEKQFKQRESIERHIYNDHNVGSDTKLFVGASTGEHRVTFGDHYCVFVLTRAVSGQQTTQSNGDASVELEVPSPTEHFPQGVDSAGQGDDSAGQGDGSLSIRRPLTSLNFTVAASEVDSATVRLMPSTDYLKSNDVMDAMGVCMHTALKILICYDCGAALTSEMVAGHRKNFHPSYKACS